MINNQKVLAIIPARAGSKRVKNKNIRDLGGKPLITWTIEAAKNSKYIDHIFVSTDSKEIQQIAENNSVSSTPLRSTDLSSDTAKTTSVVSDLLVNYFSEYDYVMLLQPTSPLRTTEDIDNSLSQLIDTGVKSIVSVCETEVHPTWVTELDSNVNLDNLIEQLNSSRSQDLNKNYQLNGAIYISFRELFLKENSFYIKGETFAFIMDRKNSIDIDTEEDFKFAESFILR
jgi:CMP-N-acetylneuraminic acid synthetase